MSDARLRLALYLSAPHECSYLPERSSQSVFADPDAPMSVSLYSHLLRRGFRRSGRHVYAPHCERCAQCTSVRIPVDEFEPRRTHRRVLKANPDVEVIERPAEFDAEHFDLYQRYTRARHEDGEMAKASGSEYMRFLSSDWCETRFLELRAQEQLIAVAVTDVIDDGLSAVYTFFDPELKSRSLGTLGILRQIELARVRRRPYLYLGYWIQDSRKMAYKGRFRPLELWQGGIWRRFGPADALPDMSLTSGKALL